MSEEIMRQMRAEMVERQLRGRGIRDKRVLEVMGRIPRENFLGEAYRERAYEDCALPSLDGQTISQPYMVALMSEALEVGSGHRVLELGTGTGYQTAVLAELTNKGEVCSIERVMELSALAQAKLAGLLIGNVRLIVGDGSVGWPETEGKAEMFDRILVTAGAPRVPEALKRQMKEGGMMVVPVGDLESQTLVRVERRGGEFIEWEMVDCRFVPLVGREGWGAD